MENTAYTMAEFLADAGEFVSEAFSWMGDVVTVVVSNPLLLTFSILPLVGLGIGLYRRIRG